MLTAYRVFASLSVNPSNYWKLQSLRSLLLVGGCAGRSNAPQKLETPSDFEGLGIFLGLKAASPTSHPLNFSKLLHKGSYLLCLLSACIIRLLYTSNPLFKLERKFMDNQHKQIKGYRDLTTEEIAAMNEVKIVAEEVGELVEKISKLPETDMRWSSIAKTELQKGFMALTRSIAKPTTF